MTLTPLGAVLLPEQWGGVTEGLKAHGITTCEEFMEYTKTDLLELGHMGPKQVEVATQLVAAAVTPPMRTMAQVLATHEGERLLQTGIRAIDDAMGGGFPVGGIVELVGAAGIGKSQFCMTLAAYATIPEDCGGLDGAVVYIDTEHKLSQPRMVQVMSHLLRACCKGAFGEEQQLALQQQVQALVNRIHIIRPNTGRELSETLKQLERELERRNVKLVLLDSAAAMPRIEYELAQIAERQQQLALQASLLKGLAERFQISVVVTNQVTLRAGGAAGNGGGMRAALGVVWAHAVNTRLILEHYGQHRVVRVAKSPMSPPVASAYTISEGGVAGDDSVAIPNAPLCSVLDMGISADHHIQDAGEGFS